MFQEPNSSSEELPGAQGVLVAVFGQPIQDFSFGPDPPIEADIAKFWMSIREDKTTHERMSLVIFHMHDD